jgi:DNA-binding transcriptional MerR regulator
MQIKELARATGVDVETIRYYEKQGLMPAPARRDNGYRDYAAAHLERLSFIRHCRALDMPLGDVKRLLGFVDKPDTNCGDIDLLVDDQLAWPKIFSTRNRPTTQEAQCVFASIAQALQ